MKTIHMLCSVQVDYDEYSELLNPESNLSLKTLVHQALENGESTITFSDPLIQIPLPPK